MELALKTKTCRTLFDAWLSWRGDRALPLYADRDPISIASILPMVGIVDVRDRQTAILRLAGSGLRDIFGFDATGGNLVDLIAAEYRLRRAYRLHVPATTPCGYLGKSQFSCSDGVTDWFESIGLPLQAGDGDGHSMIIFTLESLNGNRWYRKTGSAIDNPQNVFRFIDIGTGTPPPIDPPDDFLASFL